MKFLFALTLMISFQGSIFAFEGEFVECEKAERDYFRIGLLKMQVVEKINEQCMLSISHADSYPKYRNYMFNTASNLIVFNSFDGGHPSVSTGARSYIFFPKKQKLAFKILADGILVRVQSGDIFKFSKDTGDLESIKGIYYIFDEEVRGDNDGGLELHPQHDLILDEGYQQGELPRIHMKRQSTFKDAHGKMCSRPNKELFKYIFDSRGRVDGAKFLFHHPVDLKNYLKNHCPEIQF